MKTFTIDPSKIVTRPWGDSFTSHYPNPNNESIGFRRNYHGLGRTEQEAIDAIIAHLIHNGGVMPAEVQA